MAVEGDLEEMARNELYYENKTLRVICSKSVARIRLMKTENCSECATVNYKVCRSAIAL
jgi:hypothetical protein